MSEDENMSVCEKDVVDSEELDFQGLYELENNAPSGLFGICLHSKVLLFCRW